MKGRAAESDEPRHDRSRRGRAEHVVDRRYRSERRPTCPMINGTSRSHAGSRRLRTSVRPPGVTEGTPLSSCSRIRSTIQAMNRSRRTGDALALSAFGGLATSLVTWLLLVRWDFSRSDQTGHVVAGVTGAVLLASVVASGVAYTSREAGQAFLLVAYITTLVLFTIRSVAADDLLWPIALLLLALVALGAFVIAFALGRRLRTGSTMTRPWSLNRREMAGDRELPPIAVQILVWTGLTILFLTVAAFIWLFVLGMDSRSRN